MPKPSRVTEPFPKLASSWQRSISRAGVAVSLGGLFMLTVTPSISLVSTDTLARYFAAGASLAARSIRYHRAADMILADQLTAERIVRLFSSSASTKWRQDAAMIVLCGSISEYHASPQIWRPEPLASLARGLTGDAFAELSDAATRFVRQQWVEIGLLAAGAVAA